MIQQTVQDDINERDPKIGKVPIDYQLVNPAFWPVSQESLNLPDESEGSEEFVVTDEMIATEKTVRPFVKESIPRLDSEQTVFEQIDDVAESEPRSLDAVVSTEERETVTRVLGRLRIAVDQETVAAAPVSMARATSVVTKVNPAPVIPASVPAAVQVHTQSEVSDEAMPTTSIAYHSAKQTLEKQRELSAIELLERDLRKIFAPQGANHPIWKGGFIVRGATRTRMDDFLRIEHRSDDPLVRWIATLEEKAGAAVPTIDTHMTVSDYIAALYEAIVNNRHAVRTPH